MDTFSVELSLAQESEDEWRAVHALVGTGSLYTWLPADLLAQLGVQPEIKRNFQTHDGRHIVRDVGFVKVRLNGEEQRSLVVFGEPGIAAVLGKLTLDEFGLGIDPVSQRLVPVPGLALSGPAR